MFCNVIYTIADDSHRYIMPRHAAILRLTQLIVEPILNALEIEDSVIVEILPGKDLGLHPSGVSIRKSMLMIIPSSKAQINAADKG